jgi:hypothetical protein
MPDYGVGRSVWNPLPWDWATTRLIAARNYWLATVGVDASPHALPVWGVWNDEESRFCFSCGVRSKKASNISANPAVVVAPEDTVECVSMQGDAHIVTEQARRLAWADRYLAKYARLSPELTVDFVLSNTIVEVVPTKVFAVIEREEDFATRATRWSFTRNR